MMIREAGGEKRYYFYTVEGVPRFGKTKKSAAVFESSEGLRVLAHLEALTGKSLIAVDDAFSLALGGRRR